MRLVGADRSLRAAPYIDTTSAITINSLNGNFSYGMSTLVAYGLRNPYRISVCA